MKFIDFQGVMSIPRISRYLTATGRDSRKAMTLYRLNLRLSQELFIVISCFEVALRNRIDQHYSRKNGNDWLRDAALPGPAKPISTRTQRYDHSYIFAELEKINLFRNRLAHHEPVCFLPGHAIKSTTFSHHHYALTRQLFKWMQIDEAALLYGIDHIAKTLKDIDKL